MSIMPQGKQAVNCVLQCNGAPRSHESYITVTLSGSDRQRCQAEYVSEASQPCRARWFAGSRELAGWRNKPRSMTIHRDV